ncbi:MAG: phosphatidylserine decarboxylase family protein [Deltaproteobacteria bacterium]|nr:phosphatidylserine decarboxylase family protein [Deltaproteobacteria bacterium]
MNYKTSPIIIDAFFFFIPLAVMAALLIHYGQSWGALALFVLMFFVLWFFRNPERSTTTDEKTVLSPADGKVIKIEEVREQDLITGDFVKISIFMNVFNVHVNRLPCSGEVTAIHYRKGKFLSANLDKASELNERNSILIKTDEGKDVLTIQIAGIVARRIVCWIGEGMKAARGERFGLIRFGSRLEVFLPAGSKVLVRVGDRVRSGETGIGYLS